MLRKHPDNRITASEIVDRCCAALSECITQDIFTMLKLCNISSPLLATIFANNYFAVGEDRIYEFIKNHNRSLLKHVRFSLMKLDYLQQISNHVKEYCSNVIEFKVHGTKILEQKGLLEDKRFCSRNFFCNTKDAH